MQRVDTQNVAFIKKLFCFFLPGKCFKIQCLSIHIQKFHNTYTWLDNLNNRILVSCNSGDWKTSDRIAQFGAHFEVTSLGLKMPSGYILTWSFSCMCSKPSFKNSSHIGIGCNHFTHFELNISFKGPISKYSYIKMHWRLVVENMNLRREDA